MNTRNMREDEPLRLVPRRSSNATKTTTLRAVVIGAMVVVAMMRVMAMPAMRTCW